MNAHNILQENKEHRVIPLKDFQEKDYEDVFKRPAICKKEHHGNVLQYYCQGCEVAACQVCLNLEHGGHNIKHLEVVTQEEKAKIQSQIGNAKTKMQKFAEDIEAVETDLLHVQEHTEAVKREVNSFAEEMIRVIQEQQRQLITEAENAKVASQDRLTDDKEKIENQVQKIQLEINQAENLLQRGASAEIVQSRKRVVENLQQLVAEEPQTQAKEYSKVVFAENPFLASNLTTHGIGHLGTTHTDRVQSTAEGKGLNEAVTGLEAEFVVTTRNSKGDVYYSSVDLVTVEIKRLGDEEPVKNVQIQDNKNGTYQVSYFAADPGDHDVRVTVNKEDARRSPFPPIQVKPREFKPVMSFGSKETGPGEFKCLWGVAVNEHGEIAVTDFGNHRVQVFSNEGEFLLSFGEKGSEEGQFRYPCGVTYDRNGNLLVVDTDNKRIQQFSGRGQFIRIFGAEGELDGKLNKPFGISTCPDGNIIVLDIDNKRAVVFSPEGRVLLTLHDEKLNPYHCIYHDNRFIVSDGNENCIKVYSEQGDFLYQFGKKGTGNGDFDCPRGLAIEKSGRLVVCDRGNNRLQLFKLDGTFCCKFGGNFNRPVSVAVLRDGRFSVTQYSGHKVQLIQ